LSLIKELKRRNVFKVGVAYLVVSWLIIQISALAVPALNLPAMVNTLVFYFLLIGFPVALLFAWAYELTPEGIKKSKHVESEASITHLTGRKIDFIIIGALILVIIGLSYSHYNQMPIEQKQDNVGLSESVSIAVLPFADMSPDKDHEYFSDGISDEILNLLAKIPKLRVTSRSSAFSFKSVNPKPGIPEIAEKLGVNHVLEGSVRKSGNQVRITAQLIDAASDKHLWSETYDRNLSDIFKVQDEISAAIVKALKAKLGINIVSHSSNSQSINPEAYDLYLQGKQAFENGSFEGYEEAIDLYKASLEIEPNFENSLLGLATTQLRQIGTGSKKFNPEVLIETKQLVDKVLEKNHNSGDAYVILAMMESLKDSTNRSLIKNYIKEAYRLDPYNAEIIATYAGLLGKKDEETVKALFKRAEKIDPLNVNILLTKAGYLENRLNQYNDAELAYKKSANLNPKDPNSQFLLSVLYAHRLGDLYAAIISVEKAGDIDREDPDTGIHLSRYYLSLGDGIRALDYVDQAISLMPNSGEALMTKVAVLTYIGDKKQALELLNTTLNNSDVFYRRSSKHGLLRLGAKLLIEQEKYLEAEYLLLTYFPDLTNYDFSQPALEYDEIAMYSPVLSNIYRISGRNAQAQSVSTRNKTIDKALLLDDKRRLNGLDYIRLADTGMGRLRDEEVIEYLEASFDEGFYGDWRLFVMMNPVFNPLHNHPRYIALVKRFEDEMARQLALVNARELQYNKMQDKSL